MALGGVSLAKAKADHDESMDERRQLHELTAEEIARQIGGTGAAVRVALQRIRQQLRECVERQLRAEGESP